VPEPRVEDGWREISTGWPAETINGLFKTDQLRSPCETSTGPWAAPRSVRFSSSHLGCLE
jgi:hypothetical protein